MVNNVILSY